MRSQNQPEDVMTEVFRAMKALNFVRGAACACAADARQQWKIITPYHCRAQCVNQISGNLVAPHAIHSSPFHGD